MSILHLLTPATPFAYLAATIIVSGGEPIRLFYSVPRPFAVMYTVPAAVDLTYTVPGPISLTYDMDGGL